MNEARDPGTVHLTPTLSFERRGGMEGTKGNKTYKEDKKGKPPAKIAGGFPYGEGTARAWRRGVPAERPYVIAELIADAEYIERTGGPLVRPSKA